MVILALLAACAGQEPPVAASPPPSPRAPTCQEELAATGAVFQPIGIGASAQAMGCSLVDGVKLTRTTVDLNRPVELTCPTALRLTRFEREVLQPDAQRIFGKRVATINHAGGFVCRTVGGKRYLSEHAHGRAIDIWGFVLSDGHKVSVSKDWTGGGRDATFLRQIARDGCGVWTTVLSPNADASHADHLHLDIGGKPACK